MLASYMLDGFHCFCSSIVSLFQACSDDSCFSSLESRTTLLFAFSTPDDAEDCCAYITKSLSKCRLWSKADSCICTVGVTYNECKIEVSEACMIRKYIFTRKQSF